MCYDEIMERNIGDIGETLYTEHFYFCNTHELLNKDYQQIIKEYTYCKSFNTAPYNSLQETPAQIADDFMLIENELKQMKSKDNNG